MHTQKQKTKKEDFNFLYGTQILLHAYTNAHRQAHTHVHCSIHTQILTVEDFNK